MRKVLAALLALGAAIGAGQQAEAAPVVISPPAPEQRTQAVQYYDDWRYRQFRRREAFEARQRFREQRFLERQFYGPRYGYGPPRGYRNYGYYGPRY